MHILVISMALAGALDAAEGDDALGIDLGVQASLTRLSTGETAGLGFGLVADAGWRWTPSLTAALSVGVAHVTMNETLQGTSGSTAIAVERRLQSVPILLGATYHLRLVPWIQPFVAAHLGVSAVSFESTSKLGLAGTSTVTERHAAFTGQVGAGFEIPLVHGLGIGVGAWYQRAWMQDRPDLASLWAGCHLRLRA